MASSSVEQELSSLDRRVAGIEKQLSASRLHFSMKSFTRPFPYRITALNNDKMARIFAWFLLTVSTLGLMDTWLASQVYNPYLAVMFFISLWLVARSSSVFSLSDSTLELDRQSRSKRALHPQSVHFQPIAARRPSNPSEHILSVIRDALLIMGALLFSFTYTWFVARYVLDPSWQAFWFLAIIIAALLYSVANNKVYLQVLCLIAAFALLIMGNSPIFSVLAVTVITASAVYIAVSAARWHLLLLILVMAYGTIARWISLLLSPSYLQSVASQDVNTLSVAIASSLLVFLILFALPFIWRRRLAEEREVARAILFGNAAAFTALSLWLLSQGQLDGWSLTNFFTLFVSMCFGYIAYIYAGRYSYAKYYFIISVIATLFLVLAQPNHTVINIMWFIFSVLLLAVGFLVNSHSLRVMGLGTLAIAVSYYFSYIMTSLLENPSGQGIIEAAWLGFILVAFLLVVAGWYRGIKTRGMEMMYQDLIVQVCGLAILFILFAWVQLTEVGSIQSFLWMCIGLLAVQCARHMSYHFIQALGIALIFVGTIKLILIDTQALADGYRAGFLIAFSVLLVWSAYLIWRYPKQIIQYLK